MAQPPLGRSGGDKTTHVGYPMGQRKRKIKRGGGGIWLLEVAEPPPRAKMQPINK
jgi:hypothetical protein